MQKEIKKILSLGVLVLGVVTLAGCGAGNDLTKEPMQKQTDKSAKEAVKVEAPSPTGKVDATIDAIISGADSEKAQVVSDEAETRAIIDDSADSNNLSKTYEQEL